MRFFELFNFQHVMAYLFPALLFMVVFGVGLGYLHLHTNDAESRKKAIIGRYADGIKTVMRPFPCL